MATLLFGLQVAAARDSTIVILPQLADARCNPVGPWAIWGRRGHISRPATGSARKLPLRV